MCRTESEHVLRCSPEHRVQHFSCSQGMWADAKVIFEICAEKYETAFSYLNLGVANLNLGDYEAAEKLLKKANVLDIANANVWGYMTLVMLKSGNRVNSAFQSIKEAIRLKIVNQNLLLECA